MECCSGKGGILARGAVEAVRPGRDGGATEIGVGQGSAPEGPRGGSSIQNETREVRVVGIDTPHEGGCRPGEPGEGFAETGGEIPASQIGNDFLIVAAKLGIGKDPVGVDMIHGSSSGDHDPVSEPVIEAIGQQDAGGGCHRIHRRGGHRLEINIHPGVGVGIDRKVVGGRSGQTPELMGLEALPDINHRLAVAQVGVDLRGTQIDRTREVRRCAGKEDVAIGRVRSPGVGP